MKINFSIFNNLLKRYDFSFFGLACIIFLFGIINLFSATASSSDAEFATLYQVQIGRFLIAMGLGLAISFVNTKNIFRFAYIFYIINVLLLIMVLIMGHVGMGAQRWLVLGPIRLQPSEIMRITTVLAVSRWFFSHSPEQEIGLKDLIIPGILVMIPAILTILQPDLGTGMLLLLIFAIMIFYRRLRWKTIAILGVVGVLTSFVMYNYGLREYQQKRIITFIDPDLDAKGSGYNAIQSKIAIGSGKFLGKGYRNSSQASLNYLPENHTDFAFSLYSEEHGFFGAVLPLSLYFILIYRFVWLTQSVTRFYDSLLSVGLMSILFWHAFINMGMVMGLLPIVGIPLPFFSYGGSSLITFGICCGIATSMSNARNFF